MQRGDAEMEQKMNRVLRGCVESGENNPICSLHDQGAGGNGERREEGFVVFLFFISFLLTQLSFVENLSVPAAQILKEGCHGEEPFTGFPSSNKLGKGSP